MFLKKHKTEIKTKQNKLSIEKKPRVKNKKDSLQLEEIKNDVKPINIFDAINYNSFYVFEAAKLRKEKINENVLFYEFHGMKESVDFFKSQGLMAGLWERLTGSELIKQYNFKILELRKFLRDEDIKNKNKKRTRK